jgi:hypothetical protein
MDHFAVLAEQLLQLIAVYLPGQIAHVELERRRH